MTGKNLKMLDAAVATFARYGVKRTTMGDVATEAGISRQTLYSSFPNKDELLAAAILHLSEGIMSQVYAEWETVTNFDEQLDIYFKRAVIAVFEMIKTSPVVDGIAGQSTEFRKDVAARALLKVGEMAQRALAEKLSPFRKEIEDTGQTIEQFAAFIYTTAKGLENIATTSEELLPLLESLKISILKTIQST